MITSSLLCALIGLAVPTIELGRPTWEDDYRVARQLAAQNEKPLCVVLGKGKAGWQTLSQQGELTDKTQSILAEKYVCVYVDTTSANGKKLAEAFEMSGGQGIVISDKTGDLQAFRHEGKLTDTSLETNLNTYANPNRRVATTVSNPAQTVSSGVRTSYYSPSSATQSQPISPSTYNARPINSYPQYSPATYSQPSFGGFNGGFGGSFGGFGGGFGGCAGGT